jgi:hypothetical protein
MCLVPPSLQIGGNENEPVTLPMIGSLVFSVGGTKSICGTAFRSLICDATAILVTFSAGYASSRVQCPDCGSVCPRVVVGKTAGIKHF